MSGGPQNWVSNSGPSTFLSPILRLAGYPFDKVLTLPAFFHLRKEWVARAEPLTVRLVGSPQS